MVEGVEGGVSALRKHRDPSDVLIYNSHNPPSEPPIRVIVRVSIGCELVDHLRLGRRR